MVGVLLGSIYLASYFIPNPIRRHAALSVGGVSAVFIWSYNAAAFLFNAPETAAAPLCIVLTIGGMWALSRRVSCLIAEIHLSRTSEEMD